MAALLDLVFVDPAGKYALRAIQTLQAVVAVNPGSAPLLSDLAAAHLVRVEHGGTLMDLQQAVEASERALELDPGYPPALFNLALALDGMALDGQASAAWKEVAAGPPSDWSREAERRVARLSAPAAPWRRAGDSLAYDATEAPQEARQFAMDTLLGAWGDAVLAGDSAAAEEHLRDAATIGEALRERGGDLTVADLVQAIRGHAHDSGAMRQLAKAHQLYARGQALLAARDNGAQARFDSALASGCRSPVLAQWSKYFRGVAMFYAQHPGGAAIFQALEPRVDSLRHPVLAGRVRWSLGTPRLRRGEYGSARELFAAAGRFFAQAGESENLGSVRELEGEALFGLNDERGAYDRMWSALRALRPYRTSLRLHNLLYAASDAATARGLNHAALRLQEEDVLVGSRQRRLVYVEALVARARTFAAAGRYGRAWHDVEESRGILSKEDSSFERDWQVHQLRFAEGSVLVRSQPQRAVKSLDAVVDFFRAQRVRSRVVAAQATRAEAHLALRDTTRALADLDSAAVLVDSLGAAAGDASVRAQMREKGRRIFDGLVMLHVRAGRPAQALAALERGRAVLGTSASRGVPAEPSAPAGEVVLDYTLIGDTLLAFAVQGGRVWLAEDRVDRRRLLATASLATAALELRAPLDSLLPPLAALHRQLLRPVAAYAPPGARLVVVADGELADVPFAALWDARRGRYLLQDHPLRLATSVADAHRPLPPPSSAPAVFVADPAFDPDQHPELPRLAATAAAAREIARDYPSARVLVDTGARVDRVSSALPGAGMVHFGGHAVFDPDRPAASFLVLAPASAGGDRLTAAELEHMQLQGVRLVVLAACETQRSATGRTGGFAGLSGAILAAGAGGVVGSTWHVNERLTNQLMKEFHRRYRASGNAAEALRGAQLDLLASRDPALRSPAAWAGFRYEGS